MSNKHRRWIERSVAVIVLFTAIGFIIFGLRRTYTVGEFDPVASDVFIPEIISERQLVEDATFTGVKRQDAQLFSTYDRTIPRAKQACPT